MKELEEEEFDKALQSLVNLGLIDKIWDEDRQEFVYMTNILLVDDIKRVLKEG